MTAENEVVQPAADVERLIQAAGAVIRQINRRVTPAQQARLEGTLEGRTPEEVERIIYLWTELSAAMGIETLETPPRDKAVLDEEPAPAVPTSTLKDPPAAIREANPELLKELCTRRRREALSRIYPPEFHDQIARLDEPGLSRALDRVMYAYINSDRPLTQPWAIGWQMAYMEGATDRQIGKKSGDLSTVVGSARRRLLDEISLIEPSPDFLQPEAED